jgi:hypothetical protein
MRSTLIRLLRSHLLPSLGEGIARAPHSAGLRVAKSSMADSSAYNVHSIPLALHKGYALLKEGIDSAALLWQRKKLKVTSCGRHFPVRSARSLRSPALRVGLFHFQRWAISRVGKRRPMRRGASTAPESPIDRPPTRRRHTSDVSIRPERNLAERPDDYRTLASGEVRATVRISRVSLAPIPSPAIETNPPGSGRQWRTAAPACRDERMTAHPPAVSAPPAERADGGSFFRVEPRSGPHPPPPPVSPL